VYPARFALVVVLSSVELECRTSTSRCVQSAVTVPAGWVVVVVDGEVVVVVVDVEVVVVVVDVEVVVVVVPDVEAGLNAASCMTHAPDTNGAVAL
jgi:hypothetical protein